MKKTLSITCMIIVAGALVFAAGQGEGSKAGSSVGTVKIGFILGVTGIYANYGVPMRDAMKWSVDVINAKGGFDVGGKKYRLEALFYDHASQPELEAPLLIKKAIFTDQVSFLAFDLAGPAKMAIDSLTKTETPGVIVLSTPEDSPSFSPYLFRIRPDASQCCPPLAYHFVKTKGAKKIAIICWENEDGRDQDRIFKKYVEMLGGEVVSEQFFSYGKVDDFYPMLSKIKPLNVDAIITQGLTVGNSLIFKQAKEMGFTVPMGGFTGMTPEQAKELIGDNFNEIMAGKADCRGIDPNVHPDAKGRQWYKDFMKKFGYSGADLTMWAWDLPFIVVKTLQEAGTVQDRAKIFSTFANLKIPIKGTMTPYTGTNGKLFSEGRQANSLTVALEWNRDKKDWDTLDYFHVVDGKVVRMDMADLAKYSLVDY